MLLNFYINSDVECSEHRVQDAVSTWGMHCFHLCPNVEQHSAITYHGFCVGMGLMYVTLPRNIMQRFSKHSGLMLLKYPRVSQHLTAWNILAQNSSKQNFLGRVIMSSGKKNWYPFLTSWQWFHKFFVSSWKW